MKIMTYSDIKKNLATAIDKVNEDHTPIIITRKNGQHAVLMSLADFKAYEETAYLMASSKNAQRLNHSITQILLNRSK